MNETLYTQLLVATCGRSTGRNRETKQRRQTEASLVITRKRHNVSETFSHSEFVLRWRAWKAEQNLITCDSHCWKWTFVRKAPSMQLESTVSIPTSVPFWIPCAFFIFRKKFQTSYEDEHSSWTFCSSRCLHVDDWSSIGIQAAGEVLHRFGQNMDAQGNRDGDNAATKTTERTMRRSVYQCKTVVDARGRRPIKMPRIARVSRRKALSRSSVCISQINCPGNWRKNKLRFQAEFLKP